MRNEGGYGGLFQPGGRKPLFEPGRKPDRNSELLSPLLKKLEAIDLDGDDLLLILIFYLLYRESGDSDLLITLGALLFS